LGWDITLRPVFHSRIKAADANKLNIITYSISKEGKVFKANCLEERILEAKAYEATEERKNLQSQMRNKLVRG
jgi:hypothetical protein